MDIFHHPAAQALLTDAELSTDADREGVASIAVPMIGAGYGGLSWRKIRTVVENVYADWPGTLHVYEEYATEGGDDRVATERGGTSSSSAPG